MVNCERIESNNKMNVGELDQQLYPRQSFNVILVSIQFLFKDENNKISCIAVDFSTGFKMHYLPKCLKNSTGNMRCCEVTAINTLF